VAEQSTQTANRHGRDMTTGSIPRHLVAFSLPMLAGSFVQMAYTFVNRIWVGKFLGKEQLAAVTVSFPIIFLLVAVAIGLTMGTSILIAQFAGAREWDRLKKVVQTSTVLISCVSVASLIFGEALAGWGLRLMNTPHDVYPLAFGYMRIFLLAIPLNFGIFLASSMMRGIGDSKTPLYFQTAALLGTAILDPILMFGWLGFPRLGLNGTAIAAVTMQSLSVLAIFLYLERKDHLVAPDWRHLSVDWPTFWLTLKIGLPSIVQQSLVSVGMIFVVGIINGFGETAIAAFGAGGAIDQIAFLPALTLGAAVATVVGQNIGAGKVNRVREIFQWATTICGGMTALIAILALAVPQLLLSPFLNDAATLTVGVHYLRIVAVSYVFFAVLFVANGVINGAGYTLITTVISLVSLWAARVPLALYLSHRMHRVEGVFYAISISNAVSMSISLACYFSGFWKKPIIRHTPVAEPAEALEPFSAIE
jgi:putative MATE family efflux protein